MTLKEDISQLTQLVERLESETVDLDQALTEYASVIELSGKIMTTLQQTQDKLQILHKEGEKWISREESI